MGQSESGSQELNEWTQIRRYSRDPAYTEENHSLAWTPYNKYLVPSDNAY